MPITRRHSQKGFYISVSMFLSLVFHIIFIILTSKIKIHGIDFDLPKPTPSRFLKLQNVIIPGPEIKPEKREVKLFPSYVKNLDKEEVSQEKIPDNAISVGLSLPDKHLAKAISMLKTGNLLDNPKAAASPEIIQIDGNKLPQDRLNFNRIIIPDMPRLPSSFGGNGTEGNGESGGNASPPIPLQMRVNIPPYSPQKISPAEDRLLPQEKFSILDSLIEIRIFKYPVPSEGGYFRIDMIPKKKHGLVPFKKDLIFCIDVSGSISREKLDEFRQGVSEALSKMNTDDRFEIIAFRQKNYPLFGTFMPCKQETVAKADDFLFKLTRTGSTNIFGALEPFAGDREPYQSFGRPRLLFLASDGQVNTGELVDSRELINTFSNMNQGSTSLFTFSTGKGANTFLLDLLAYRNRGESISSPNAQKSTLTLEKFIDNVSKICVMNLDYQITGELADLTFPKKLPHLYEDHILSVYGSYPEQTNFIGLRITGKDSSGANQELIYKADLSKAEMAGPDLPKMWALNYIYHLYSQLTVLENDEKTRIQIHKIAAKFALELPYLDSYLVAKKKRYLDQNK